MRRARSVAGRRISALVGAAVLGALVGTGTYAIAASHSSVISACASKRTGALRVLVGRRRCGRSERAVSWSQAGPPGRPGPRGLVGPPGSAGAAGTVDTSSFYDKAQSDGRFLPLHGTADDASKLGGHGIAGLVTNDSVARARASLGRVNTFFPGGGTGPIHLPLGDLQVTCSEPASSASLTFSFARSAIGGIERDHGGSVTGDVGHSDSPLLTAQNDRVQYFLGSGNVQMTLDLWIQNDPASDTCVTSGFWLTSTET